MKTIIVAAILCALSISASAQSAPGVPTQTSVALPYYNCLKMSVARYARKAQSFTEAMDGARGACEASRKKLLYDIVAGEIVNGGITNDPKIDAEKIIQIFEAKFRPSLTQAYLEAR